MVGGLAIHDHLGDVAVVVARHHPADRRICRLFGSHRVDFLVIDDRGLRAIARRSCHYGALRPAFCCWMAKPVAAIYAAILPGRETMLTRRLLVLAALVAGTISTESLAQTPDKLKVAISQRGFWDSSFLEFAQKEGFLKEANLDVEFFYTEGGGQTLQIITSGSVDVAMSNGLLGTIGAFSKGAPIRVISAQMTGAHELFWYVKADSPIKSLKDADNRTAAFSAPGSSSNLILLSLLKQAGSKAKPTATGGLPGTLTSVMTGQI